MSAREELYALIAQLDDDQVQHARDYIAALRRDRVLPARRRWEFDFIARFDDAKVSAQRDRAGMEVKVADASCGGVVRRALWEHPPLAGAAVISYVIPIPPNLHGLSLKFYTGIRDGSQLPADRYVAFRLMVNGWKLWSAVKNSRTWEEYIVPMPELSSDVARIEFQTDGLGDHRWNWAAWGEPKLIADA